MPRMFWIALALLAVALTRPCSAQNATLNLRRDEAPPARAEQNRAANTTPRQSRGVGPATQLSPGSLAVTPEMWFYEQERKRHDDPKMAVRRRAEQCAQERHERLAALRWYGIDNSRPTVSPTPWFGEYSAYWGSNTYDPQRWRPMTAPVVVMRPTERPN
jgi:hypothetical protein